MKYVLFTGAGGGLGSACARVLGDAGWTVLAADIHLAALDDLKEAPRVIPLAVDVTDQASIDLAVETVRQTTDKLDAIVNFAGIHAMASMVEGDIVETMNRMIGVNVMGMVRVNRAFFELLRPGGRIVNCSSECGYMKAQPFNGLYAATKYAVEAYTDSLRRELLSQDIKVVKIQPGSFQTGLLSDAETSFEKLLSITSHYQRVLTKMKPMMMRELKAANDPAILAKVLLRALESRSPRINYRVRNSRLMGLLELVPDSLLDAIYKVFMSGGL